MLSKDLMEILRCPKCGGMLRELASPEGLSCTSCMLFYAIVQGIPNLLIEEARPLSAPATQTT